jgi:5-methylcytosine-specific restriction endonuclease McrA
MSVHSSKGQAWELLCKQVIARDGGVCQYQMGGGCTNDKDLTVDHILAKANGGTDTEHNLITACRSCNSKKGMKMMNRAAWTNTRWFN